MYRAMMAFSHFPSFTIRGQRLNVWQVPMDRFSNVKGGYVSENGRLYNKQFRKRSSYLGII